MADLEEKSQSRYHSPTHRHTHEHEYTTYDVPLLLGCVFPRVWELKALFFMLYNVLFMAIRLSVVSLMHKPNVAFDLFTSVSL